MIRFIGEETEMDKYAYKNYTTQKNLFLHFFCNRKNIETKQSL